MSKLSKRQDKKRQQRQRERERSSPAALAYHGNKYRTRALILPLLETETAIVDAFEMLNHELTDHEVSRALVQLIEQVRRGAHVSAGWARAPADNRVAADDRPGAVAQMIRIRWRDLGSRMPGRDNLIGILRSILGSVEEHKTVSPTSRGYLNFVKEFLEKLESEIRDQPESATP